MNKNNKNLAQEYKELMDLENELEFQGMEMDTQVEIDMSENEEPSDLHYLNNYKTEAIYNFLNSSYKTQQGQLVIETPIGANIDTKTVDAKSYLSSSPFTITALSFYEDSILDYLLAEGKNKEYVSDWVDNINTLFASLDSLNIARDDLNARADEALNSVELFFEHMKSLYPTPAKKISAIKQK